MNTVRVLTAVTLSIVGAVAQAAPITFDLSGNDVANFDNLSSSFSLTQGGLTATFDAKALTRNPGANTTPRINNGGPGAIDDGHTVQDARVGRFSEGLGISNSSGDGSFSIDGNGADDFVQITFSSIVRIVEVTFGSVSRRDDFRILTDSTGDGEIGNGDSISEQFTVRDDRPFTGFDGLETNTFGIGAFTSNDSFKLNSITVFFEPSVPTPAIVPPSVPTPSAVPLPAAGWMLLSVLGGLGVFRRFRKV